MKLSPTCMSNSSLMLASVTMGARPDCVRPPEPEARALVRMSCSMR